VDNIKSVFRFAWHYLRRYWVRLLAGVLLGVVFGLTNASFVWATRTLINRFEPEVQVRAEVTAVSEVKKAEQVETVTGRVARWGERMGGVIDGWLPRMGTPMSTQQFLGGLLLLPLLVGIRSSADYLSSYSMGWVSERVMRDMRIEVLDKLSSLSLAYFQRSTTGDLLTRINTDTAALLRCLREGTTDLVKESISLLSVLAALLWINWQLTLVAMVFMPLCLFPLLVLGRKARHASRASINAVVEQSSQLVELLGGIRIIKAYNLEAQQMTRYRKSSQSLVRHGMKGIQAKELVNPLIEIISMLGLGVLVVYIFSTQTSTGDFVGLLTGLMLFFLPIKKLARVHIVFEQGSVGVQRLRELLSEQPAVREPASPRPISGFQREIRFEGVTFSYEPDRPVLSNLNLVLPRGARIGVAGASGSGKSTLVNVLLRFYDPDTGTITIDGVDLRDLSFRDLRQLMALVSQDIILFDQTVAENIALGRPGATREEIEAAAHSAYAHEFIVRLPRGYDARIGERGVSLSGGQRQRLAIARAFVRNAPILVLDEATASLDSQAEAEVQAAIERLEQNRTVLCVAHRLSTLANMDRIIVLAEGRMVESGTFQELLMAKGLFAAMAHRQGLTADAQP
jgi:ABC-type multidrug transport system fused ATPase/permease subunit